VLAGEGRGGQAGETAEHLGAQPGQAAQRGVVGSAELFELPRSSRLAYALRQFLAAPALRRDLAGCPSITPTAEG